MFTSSSCLRIYGRIPSQTRYCAKWQLIFRKVSPKLRRLPWEILTNIAEDEMLEITNIDPDKVARYGRIFLKLIKDAHQGYEAMMRQQEERPQDPNHQTTVIDISSDDEYGDGGDLDDFDADEESLGEPSRYFPADDVNAFNAQRRRSLCGCLIIVG